MTLRTRDARPPAGAGPPAPPPKLEKKPRNVPKKRTNHLPQYSSPVQLTPNGPRRPRTASERLIMRPPGPFRPAYTPWGYCDRLGWLVVACGCHPQPSRRPRALKVAAAGSGQRRRGGVLRVTRVTTTGTRGVGRDPAAAVFFLAKKKGGCMDPGD